MKSRTQTDLPPEPSTFHTGNSDSQPGVIPPPTQGTFDNVCRHFWMSKLAVQLPLALSRQGSGMLLNIPQCTGQSSKTKNYPAPNVNGAKVENLHYTSSDVP